MSKRQMKNENEQRFIETCMKRLEKNQRQSVDNNDRSNEWYDFYSRTNEVLVPSKWISRLDEANAVNNHLQYLREKIEQDFPKETEKINREALYCSSAMHNIRQNAFHKRLHEHQIRWQPIMLIGELASSLPKPTTDPIDIEKQLYMSLLNKK
ncbi:unnamed protein product [Rotaria sp. Silwood1]|nr:unnamed protein product [Rotaria sp. Silwood1]CAF0863155.1 unnamed protein product [Rotaria sp. Silwood1]CAF3365251.1 unnamed protein product [Rotaria sp. Silwood1]CAF3381023.1 unnamed protein product [Rotaria sp. Silwood1]CAF4630322.1 unnamed protein product [Rotaria sp. Silwood1]